MSNGNLVIDLYGLQIAVMVVRLFRPSRNAEDEPEVLTRRPKVPKWHAAGLCWCVADKAGPKWPGKDAKMAMSRWQHQNRLWLVVVAALPHPCFFFFAAGLYPPEELVALGKHGETKVFFLSNRMRVGYRHLLVASLFFFLASSGAVLGVHVGGYQRPGKSRPGGRVHSWFRIRLRG